MPEGPKDSILANLVFDKVPPVRSSAAVLAGGTGDESRFRISYPAPEEMAPLLEGKMASLLCNWPFATNGRVLLVMGESSGRFFSRLFGSWGLTSIAVSTCEAACQFLVSEADVSLVLTDAELPDGDWRTIAGSVREAGTAAEVLVRHSDWELAGEKIDRAALDITDRYGARLAVAS